MDFGVLLAVARHVAVLLFFPRARSVLIRCMRNHRRQRSGRDAYTMEYRRRGMLASSSNEMNTGLCTRASGGEIIATSPQGQCNRYTFRFLFVHMLLCLRGREQSVDFDEQLAELVAIQMHGVEKLLTLELLLQIIHAQ